MCASCLVPDCDGLILCTRFPLHRHCRAGPITVRFNFTERFPAKRKRRAGNQRIWQKSYRWALGPGPEAGARTTKVKIKAPIFPEPMHLLLDQRDSQNPYMLNRTVMGRARQ